MRVASVRSEKVICILLRPILSFVPLSYGGQHKAFSGNQFDLNQLVVIDASIDSDQVTSVSLMRS